METKIFSFRNGQGDFEKRQFLPDFVKCVAIVTVVWGHAIQYWHGMGYDYWNDPFFIFIYGFHMPLFALISGYLFSFSIKKYPPDKIVAKKTIQLIVPCLLWGILMALLNIIINVLDGQRITAFLLVKEIVYQSLYDFWFFKAVFVSSVLSLVVEKTPMKKGMAYFLLCVGTIFAPSIFNLQTIAFVFPYFVLGISYGKINKQLSVSNKVFWFAAVGYLLLIILWKKECYIYISGMSVFSAENIANQMIIIVYRFLVGLLGSIAIIGVLERIENKIRDELKRKITLVGSKTGTIYLLSTMLFLYSVKILEKISPDFSGGNGFFSMLIDLLILFPISILVILICIKVETRLFRHTAINKFLFGRW